MNLIAIEKQYINQILEISKVCGLAHWSAKDYLKEIQRPDSFNLACLNTYPEEKIIGFLIARLIKFNDNLNNLSDKQHYQNNKTIGKMDEVMDEFDEAEILNIAVSPEHQNKGTGQFMIYNFIRFCLNGKSRKIWLEVRESNTKAQKFYQKNGFETVYTRKNYYQNTSESALIMLLELKPD